VIRYAPYGQAHRFKPRATRYGGQSYRRARSKMALHPPRAAIIAERLTLVAAVRGISSTNSTVLGTL
jgi:hypothetical protein